MKNKLGAAIFAAMMIEVVSKSETRVLLRLYSFC